MGKTNKALDMTPPSAGVYVNFPKPAPMKTEEYLQSYVGYVYTAVSAIAQEVASIDLHLYEKKYVKGRLQTEEIGEHELLSVLDYVNPISTFYDLVEATQIYMELVGECYWVLIKDTKTKQPREIWLLRPDWVTVIPSEKDFIGGYRYNPGGISRDGIDLPVDSVVPFKYFNPTNPFRGKGSVQAAAMPLDILNFALDYNRRFFFNSATPGLVFTTDQKPNEKMLKRFVESWMENYGGRENSHKAAFLTNGFKLDRTSTSPKDMDYNEQIKTMRDDVLAVFKVPKTILGLTDDVNRANAEATTKSFMERVITPRMIKFVNTLNEMYVPVFGDDSLFLDFTDPAPQDVEQELKVYASGLGQGAAAAWMTPNEVRAMRNLPPIAGGDTLPTKSVNGETIKEVSPEGTEGVIKDMKDTKSSVTKIDRQQLLQAITGRKKHMVQIPKKKLIDFKREKLEKSLQEDLVPLLSEMLRFKNDGGEKIRSTWDEDKKVNYWKEFDNDLRGKQVALKEVTDILFGEFENKALENLEDIKYFVAERRKGKEGSVMPLLRLTNKSWEKQLLPVITDIIQKEGQKTFEGLGMEKELDMTSDSVIRFVDSYKEVFIKEITKNTKEELMKVVGAELEEGTVIIRIRDKVKDFFTHYIKQVNDEVFNKEAQRIVNFSILEAYKQSGVVIAKEWLVDKDSKPHIECDKFNGRIKKVDELFNDKDDNIEDDISYPPFTNNCKCTIIPITRKSSGKE